MELVYQRRKLHQKSCHLCLQVMTQLRVVSSNTSLQAHGFPLHCNLLRFARSFARVCRAIHGSREGSGTNEEITSEIGVRPRSLRGSLACLSLARLSLARAYRFAAAGWLFGWLVD